MLKPRRIPWYIDTFRLRDDVCMQFCEKRCSVKKLRQLCTCDSGCPLRFEFHLFNESCLARWHYKTLFEIFSHLLDQF